jgi:hypothetical protein
MVVARSPATGTELVLQHPSEPERLVEQAVSPHLLRLNAAVQASRSEQQSLAVRQQGLMRAVADIQERVRAGAEVEAKLDRLAGEVAAMGERVAGIEVFLVRMDATLRDLGAAVRSGAPGGEGSMRKVALVALACGLAVGAIAFIILRAT